MSDVVVIVGGSGGIGSSVARALSARGCRLARAARREGPLQEVARDVGAEIAVTIDARRGEEVDHLFERVKSTYGTINGVINCVGSILLKPLHRTSEEEFRSVIDTNLITAFHVARCAVTYGGENTAIVLVSSCAAAIGLPNHEAIAASKCAIEGMSRSLAATYSSKRIRCNVVAPGLIRTPLSKPIVATPTAESFSQSLHPLGRLGEPEDVAALICFLVGAESSWITGQTFGVDGGLSVIKQGK